jgi:pyruvate-formate lyase-activating enzyme
MHPFTRLQIAARAALRRDLLSGRFYVRRARKIGVARELASCLQTKFPYAFPLPPLPYVVDVEPTNHCNIGCIMCPSPAVQTPRGFMDRALLRSIVAQAAEGGVQRLRFVGLGEPLLHPHLPEMIRIAHDAGLYTEVSTNATLLGRELGLALLDAGLDEIGISLDSVDPAEYERVRRGAKFESVMSRVEEFLALARARGDRAPITIARMVVMERSDVDAFTRRWGGQVDSLQFNMLRAYEGSAIDKGKAPATAAEHAPPPKQLARRVRCRLVMGLMPITWDGHVSLCNQSTVIVGDANVTPLRAIWRGALVEEVRRLHAGYEGVKLDVCRVCPVMEPAISTGEPLPPAQVTARRYVRDERAAAGGLVTDLVRRGARDAG